METSEFLDFDINDIYTIVQKREAGGFEFSTPCREWDGFVLFTEGEAVLRRAGKADTTVRAGDLILFECGDDYGFFAASPCAYITSGFFFSGSARLSSLPDVVHCTAQQKEKIARMADVWEQRRFDSRIACRIELLSLYLDLYQSAGGNLNECRDPAVKAALDFLHANFKRSFSADELARHCSLSPSYLRSRFALSLGMTVTEYRDSLRLKAAQELLTGGVFSIKETASELGFCDVYHFSKFFTQKCGVTPGRFVKQHRGG